MGTWGMGSFDSDGALDWLISLREDGIGVLGQAFATVRAEIDYLDVTDGQSAIVAAEIVAAAHGRPAGYLPDAAARILATRAGQIRSAPELVGQARAALARVTGEESELVDLWADTANEAVWRGHVAELDRRLGDIEA